MFQEMLNWVKFFVFVIQVHTIHSNIFLKQNKIFISISRNKIFPTWNICRSYVYGNLFTILVINHIWYVGEVFPFTIYLLFNSQVVPREKKKIENQKHRFHLYFWGSRTNRKTIEIWIQSSGGNLFPALLISAMQMRCLRQ